MFSIAWKPALRGRRSAAKIGARAMGAAKVLLICAVILLSAAPALAKEYAADRLFRISYDENAYCLDDMTYLDENVGDSYRWFFILYNEQMMFDVSMQRLAGYDNVSLTSGDEAGQSAYVDDVLDLYGDEDAALLTVLSAGAARVPFFVFSLRSEDGPYLMAETVHNGYGVDFKAYYHDVARPVDDALATALTTLLSSYAPLT